MFSITAAVRLVLVQLAAAVISGSPVPLAYAQMMAGEPVSYPKKLIVTVTNTADINRKNEPVMVSMADILRKAPDFNRNFFRVKHPAGMFEPLDIPSQIFLPPCIVDEENLVFLLDLFPRERKVVELQYNPRGVNQPEYPSRTRAFGKWSDGGTNIAWENEEAGYRSYYGLIDYFGKSYPHLRLHGLPSDSYHHEAVWGVDPFVIGGKPGICGVALIEGITCVPYYGARDSLVYSHQSFGGGPVGAGAVIGVSDSAGPVLEERYTLFAGHHENLVRAIPARRGATVAVGMQKNDGEAVRFDETQGYIVSQASAGEYGAIGLALVFDPDVFLGLEERPDSRFVKLKPSPDGAARYLAMAVWYRGSADQPRNMDALVNHAEYLSRCFLNPVRIELGE